MTSAGTVLLGGAAGVGASKPATGVPNMARTAMGGSICDRSSAYWGCAGAGHWYCGNSNLSIYMFLLIQIDHSTYRISKKGTYRTSKQGTYSTSKQGTYRTSKQGT